MRIGMLCAWLTLFNTENTADLAHCKYRNSGIILKTFCIYCRYKKPFNSHIPQVQYQMKYKTRPKHKTRQNTIWADHLRAQRIIIANIQSIVYCVMSVTDAQVCFNPAHSSTFNTNYKNIEINTPYPTSINIMSHRNGKIIITINECTRYSKHRH